MSADTCTVFSTEFGWMCVAWRDHLLRELTFGHSSPEEAVRAMKHATSVPTEPTRTMRALVRRLQRFAERAGDNFLNLELDLGEHTPFQRRVIAECRAIPVGETITYAELALRAGHPGAARAAGTVMSTNRFPLVVPCHRVVGSGGSLGGYSAPQGLEMKRRLLELERTADEPILTGSLGTSPVLSGTLRR